MRNTSEIVGTGRRRRSRHPLVRAFSGIAVAALVTVGLAVPASAAGAATTGSADGGRTVTAHNTTQFKGVNWADPNDNYSSGDVVPSGLSTSDSYATTYAKATAILTGFKNNLGANTVRLPVNPSSVGTAWWNSYKGAVDAATALGFKVILSYWDQTSSNDGVVDNLTNWWSMWSTLTTTYGGNSLVYYEPMNEPYGYSATAWANLAASWLSTYPSIPKSQIFVSGTGYNDNVTSVCADSRLNGTFLSLHHYGFWATHDYADWVTDLKNRIGSCASRTVLDEFGAPMTTGENYDGASTTDNFVAYMQADTDTVRALGIGSVYWPGLRNTDSYSMEALHGSGTSLYLTNNNQSGVDRLEYAWGGGSPVSNSPATTTLVSAASSRCLDDPSFSKTIGTKTDLWDCNGGSNQNWTATTSGALEIYGLCLDGYQQGTSPGTPVDIYTCNGGSNQQWSINANGTITEAQSGLCLDVAGGATADGTGIDLATCDGASNQHWTRG